MHFRFVGILRDELRFAEPRQGPGGLRRRGECGAGGKALRGKPVFDLAEQLGFAAKEMRRAGNVEHGAVRRIERRERRETAAPVGDIGERRGLRRFIGCAAVQAGEDGAGVGQRQAGFQPMPGGGAIYGGKSLRAFDLGDSDERRPTRFDVAAGDPIRRQRRQPEGEITRHGTRPLDGSRKRDEICRGR